MIHLRDGRSSWDIFFAAKFLSHRQSKCSIDLKIKPCKSWIKECEFQPNDTTLYFGIGFEEIERLDAIAKNWLPFKVEVPLCWEPWPDRKEIEKQLVKNNLQRPRLYDLGFAHANCGGFCPKAGMGHYRNLLEHLPDVYVFHEQREQEFREYIGKDVAILRKTINGLTVPTSLKEFREQIEKEPKQLNIFDALGGCGCFIDD